MAALAETHYPGLRPDQQPLVAVWEAFLRGDALEEAGLAPPILRAWRRCVARGLSARERRSSPLDTARSPEQERLAVLARAYLEDVYQFVEGSSCAVLLADASCTLIELLGDRPFLGWLETLGLVVGASLAEEAIGANGLDLALREAQPMQTSGAEHYGAWLHGLSIAAAPLFDISGQALGALGVISLAAAAHPHTLGMVIAAAQALHSQLRADQLLAETNDRLLQLNATLEAMSEGLIFVGPDGLVSHINSRAGQMLRLPVRATAGCRLGEVLELPLALGQALERREELADAELVFPRQGEKLVFLCNLRPVWDSARRSMGALITLRPPETVQQLVQRVIGAQAQLTFGDIIGASPGIQLALRHARIAAASPASVLIQGDLGVGKKLFAHAIHNASARSQGPFVVLNCAGLPRALLAAELFGVEGSADAGQSQQGRPGRLELASGGTLVLEEIGALPMDLQTELLRAIENQRTIRGGGLRVVPIDVRVIVTSTSELDTALDEGRFRADLYHRLSAISIQIPPLLTRIDDLLLLQDHIMRGLCQQLGKQVVLAPDALDALCAYHWPGNVRELEATLERLMHTTEKNVLTAADMPAFGVQARGTRAPGSGLYERHAEAEREAIVRAGREAGGRIGRTAEILRISRATLWRKMRQHGLRRSDFELS